MFLALKNGLGRLATFFRGLLDEYGGAAAAYSLRRLGSGYSGPLVNVRRDADDAERDFTDPSQAEDWVNGKLEDTLPADVATTAAAYSLRKVRDAYTGNALQVRRPSDNVEVNVAFDANNEVSASSAISNVEDIELVSESGFAADTGGFASSISGATFTFGNTLDGKDNVLFATFDGSGLLGLNFSTSDVAIGDVVTYSFDVYWASTNTGGLPNLRIRSGNTTIGHTDVPMPSEDSWYTFSGQFTVTSNTPTALTFIAADSSGLTTGDVFAIANGSYGKQQDAGDTTATTLGEFLTEGGNQDAYVVTWYDQSGNGRDATQDTAGEQPKIAEAGSLLADGIDFDGVNDGLYTTHSFTDTLTHVSLFAVTQDDTTSGTATVVRNRPNGSPGAADGFAWERTTGDSYGSSTLLEGVNGMVAALDAGQGTRTTTENLNTLLYQPSQILAYENGTLDETLANVRFGSVPVGDVTLEDQLWIGQNFDDNARPFDGSMKEIIVYFNDQSDNRFKIESNINNHYGIYTPAYNGFVETWYDQSGNGRHAVQDAVEGYQPKIVDAGSYLGELDFDGIDDYFAVNNVFTGTNGVSSFFVGNADSTSTAEAMFCQGSLAGAAGSAYSVSSEIAFRVGGSAVFGDDFIDANTLLLSVITPDAGTTTDAVARLNGTQLSQTSSSGTTLNYTNQNANIGKRLDTFAAYDGSLKELVIYPSDQSANRTAIESNIADEYGITLS